MFTYVIAIFIAIAALARRVLRRMYGFTSFTKKEKELVKNTLELSLKKSSNSWAFVKLLLSVLLLLLPTLIMIAWGFNIISGN